MQLACTVCICLFLFTDSRKLSLRVVHGRFVRECSSETSGERGEGARKAKGQGEVKQQ